MESSPPSIHSHVGWAPCAPSFTPLLLCLNSCAPNCLHDLQMRPSFNTKKEISYNNFVIVFFIIIGSWYSLQCYYKWLQGKKINLIWLQINIPPFTCQDIHRPVDSWTGMGGGMDSQYKLLSELLSDQAAFITSPKTSLANYWGALPPCPLPPALQCLRACIQ